MKRTAFFILIFSTVVWLSCSAQLSQEKNRFTHADSLRGSVTKERAWWDVLYYGIQIRPDYNKKFISGSTEIKFKVLMPGSVMQIDLQQPFEIKEVLWNNHSLNYTRDGNVFLINFPTQLVSGKTESINIHYDGYPQIAKRPPWDNGWIFKQDKLGRPWLTVTCQGLGASSWYPCKDYLGDEPDDGASLSITVPDTLVAVGNGRLKEKKNNGDGNTTYTWAVVNPINTYNIIPYIGKYVSWHEEYEGEKGKLDCDYWVLDYNLDKAKIEFKAVDSMLKCFEYWFGPYPFYEDGYKLVEAPHLGMEHQSAVAYGNGFKKGYAGKDLSETGWGLKWDFIIVHESGHEWFGNNITCKDIADEWIHEGFTCYSETIFTGYYFGKEAGDDYNIGQRKLIENKKPIISTYGVNNGPDDTDEYYKASSMIHTIRQIINNDSLFRQILRGLNKTFYHQTVTTEQIEHYISAQSKINFSKVFDQYLRTTKIPILEYKQNGFALSYRWTNCIKDFNMPLKIQFKGNRWIKPSAKFHNLSLYPEGDNHFSIDRNFYVRANTGF
ncbi:MAG: M1 family metallopeptidase [Bacteroidetes bacterium]|nr:M1 family metallopeptidase [Bacteroidota bacterium]